MDGRPQPASPAHRGVPDREARASECAIEERTLRLLDRFVAAKGLVKVGAVTPGMVDEFLASRPRRSGRSYNRLQGTVRRLLDWMRIWLASRST
jgi:hypothetical protein